MHDRVIRRLHADLGSPPDLLLGQVHGAMQGEEVDVEAEAGSLLVEYTEAAVQVGVLVLLWGPVLGGRACLGVGSWEVGGERLRTNVPVAQEVPHLQGVLICLHNQPSSWLSRDRLQASDTSANARALLTAGCEQPARASP